MFLTEDSKTRFYKGQKNTFGLLPGLPEKGGTCPGATSGAGGCLAPKFPGSKVQCCYMDHLLRCRPNVKTSLAKNTKEMAKKGIRELEQSFSDIFAAFRANSRPDCLYFRLYYSGDVLDVRTAKALQKAVLKFPDIKFWMYTRSLFAVKYLVECSNLQLYISTDPVNYKKASKVYERYSHHKNLALAWMGDVGPQDRLWVKCPATQKLFKEKLKLEGSDRGACAKCKLCFTPQSVNVNIRFPIH